MTKVIKMGLCKGRHEIKGVESYVFDGDVNPLDVEGLEGQAFIALSDECYKAGAIQATVSSYGDAATCIAEGTCLDLYVTGLTVALIATLNVAKEEGMEVTLYHFDRESGEYYPQAVR